MLKQKAFWVSFVCSLAVLCPLYLAVLAYVNVSQTQTAQTPQQGVWMAQPTGSDKKTVLVMTGTTTAQNPGSFALVHFNALENRISVVAFPPQTIVLVNGSPQTLAGAVASAGPSQGVSALAETLHISVDDYLFTTPAALWQAAESFGTAPLRLGQYLPPSLVKELSLTVEGMETQQVSPRVFAQVLANDKVPRESATLLRAAGYAEFLRVGTGLLQQTLPGFVRRSSAQIATDISATELYDYERVLRFLDKQDPTCRGVAAPGSYVTRSDGEVVFELSTAAAQLGQELFSQRSTAGSFSSVALSAEDEDTSADSDAEEAVPGTASPSAGQ